MLCSLHSLIAVRLGRAAGPRRPAETLHCLRQLGKLPDPYIRRILPEGKALVHQTEYRASGVGGGAQPRVGILHSGAELAGEPQPAGGFQVHVGRGLRAAHLRAAAGGVHIALQAARPEQAGDLIRHTVGGDADFHTRPLQLLHHLADLRAQKGGVVQIPGDEILQNPLIDILGDAAAQRLHGGCEAETGKVRHLLPAHRHAIGGQIFLPKRRVAGFAVHQDAVHIKNDCLYHALTTFQADHITTRAEMQSNYSEILEYFWFIILCSHGSPNSPARWPSGRRAGPVCWGMIVQLPRSCQERTATRTPMAATPRPVSTSAAASHTIQGAGE